MRWIHSARKVRFLHLAVAIGVLPGLLDRLLGDADGILAAAVIALGLLTPCGGWHGR